MFHYIIQHEEIHINCVGCIKTLKRVVVHDTYCGLHPQPRTKWWHDQKCEDYTKRKNKD